MREYLFPYYRRWKEAAEEARRLSDALRDALREASRERDDLRGRLAALERERDAMRAELDRALAALAFPVSQREVVAPDLDAFLEQVEVNYREITNDFQAYVALIDRLAGMPGVRLLPVYEFAGAHDDDALLVGLRHDIDADPVNAIRMARHLARVGVCGSFYLLHTALYYGRFEDNLFIRSPEISRWIKAMIVAGCEIGLHNDALGVSQRRGLDGPLALEREIAFLRSLGAVIRGTVGHNSLPVYGAENAEVFVGRKLWKRSDSFQSDLGDCLERLDEAALGLSYEGTFARPLADCDIARAEAFAADLQSASVRSEAWMRRYLLENPSLEWTVDVQVWVIGRDEWVVAGHVAGGPVWHWRVSQESMLDALSTLPRGVRCLLVLHPEYFRG